MKNTSVRTPKTVCPQIKIVRASKSYAGTIAKLNFFVQKIHSEAYPNFFKSFTEDGGTKQFFEQQLNDQKNFFFFKLFSRIYGSILVQEDHPLYETRLF